MALRRLIKSYAILQGACAVELWLFRSGTTSEVFINHRQPASSIRIEI